MVSQGRQYKAIGNAVPPVMMWNIVKQFQNVLKVPMLDFEQTKQQYPNEIVTNDPKLEDIDPNKNVLVSYMKSEASIVRAKGTKFCRFNILWYLCRRFG